MRQVEMQSLLGSSSEEKTNGEDEDSQSHSYVNINNLTWPKLSRTDFDIHKSPLSSLFQQNNDNDSSTTRQRNLNSRSSSFSTSGGNSASGLSQNFQDVDVQNQFDAFLSTLDRFEDEFDQQAYVELIPLNIRMALENQIFGWDHLYSATLGHVMLPLAAYLLTDMCISILGLKGVNCAKRYSYDCTLAHKVHHFHEYETDYEPMFGMNMTSFSCLKVLLSLWSAISAFRTIRRRRKVWLHHQATEYFRDNTVAFMNMEQADRETLLGRIRSRVKKRRANYLNRKIRNKLRKATGRFEKREVRRRREFVCDGASEYEGDHHRRVQVLSRRVNVHTKKREKGRIRNGTLNGSTHTNGSTHDRDENDANSLSSSPSQDSGTSTEDQERDRDNRDRDRDRNVNRYSMNCKSRSTSTSTTTTASTTMQSMDADNFFDTYQKYKRTAKDEYDRDHTESLNASNHHFYGHTMPAFAMQSITQDQIKFNNGLIENVAYAHGGFFGAAPFMLANPHWIDILRHLMPDVYVEISRRVVNTPVPQLIHWAENNPVVAAYGTAHELEYFGKVPTLEWDVFLDPHLVQRVEVVLEARDSFLQGIAEKSKRIRTALSHKRVERRHTSKMVKIATLLESDDEKKILHFYNTEIEKRVVLLVEHMLIAHGNVSQLALEQTGHLKQFNFSRIKHTLRTLGGGIYAKHWIMTYAEALKMSTEFDEEFMNDDEFGNGHGNGNSMSLSNSVTSSPIREGYGANSSSLLNDDRDDEPEVNDSGGGVGTGLSKINRSRSTDHLVGDSSSSPSSRLRKDNHQSLRTSTSFQDLALAAVTSSSISESMNALKKLMNCDAPLGLILDIKSRHVPKRIWALVLDSLRSMGARVEGIGTFFQEDIRDISKYCAAPMKEMMFFHSAGDLQKACHEGRIRRGDSIFFNAGSLFWNYPILKDKEFIMNMAKNVCMTKFDAKEYKKQYKFQPYARVVGQGKNRRRRGNSISDDSDANAKNATTTTAFTDGEQYAETDALVSPLMKGDDVEEKYFKFYEGRSSTVQQYKDHFDLSIGMYVQEFAIDEKNMELLVQYVNLYSEVYDLGFSWGGINGVTVKGIQPGRLTNTDGFWNQRYAGERWDSSLHPGRL